MSIVPKSTPVPTFQIPEQIANGNFSEPQLFFIGVLKECIQKNETNKSFCVDILLWIGIFSNTIEFVKISKQNNVNVNKPLSKAVETKLKAMYFIE